MDVAIAPEHRERIEQFRARHRTGVLTLLFTDVVGSTGIKQRLGDAAGVELIRRHQALVREVLASFAEAEEISTAGDSFFIVFVKPSDAVRFALRLQNALRSLGDQARSSAPCGRPDVTATAVLQLRIGVHMGEVFIEEKTEGALERDVLGIQVDTASRVMSLAGGGQVLLTRSVFDNARTILKGEALAGLATLSWLNHGLYSVKGVEEPIEICEVGEESLAPLVAPTDSDKARRYVAPDQEPVLGWRPAVEQTVPGTEWALEEKLGEGGFGEVWLARHRRTKELRVFKFCFRADRLRNLKREMTLFRILKEVLGERPDIARLHEVQFEQAPYYLELEYTPGGNLADWLARKQGSGIRGQGSGRREKETEQTPSVGPQLPAVGTQDSALIAHRSALESAVPLSLRLEIIAQVATALAAAHSVGVIHKDIKPSNILIEERKGSTGILPVTQDQQPATSHQPLATSHQPPATVQVRLTDFGIGQLMDRAALERAGITATGFTETAGAVSELSSRTGTRLYMAPELLAGRPPSIQSDIYSLGVLLYQLIIGDLSQPMTTDWERNIRDPLLRDDLRHCLAGDPTDRFATAVDLAHRLRALPQRRTRRRTALLVQAAAALVLVFAFAAFAFFLLRTYQLKRESTLRRETERQLYYSNIALAESCVESERYDRAPEVLAACPERFRSWEWGRLEYLCNREMVTLKETTRPITCAAFSPDGRLILTAGWDKMAVIWDVESGRRLKTLSEHTGAVFSAAFSPDGRRIVTTSADRTAKIWDAESGRRLLTLRGHAGEVFSGMFSPDGRRVTTASEDKTARIWDAETGREQAALKGHGATVRWAIFSPDGRRVVTASWDKTAKIWDVESGREQATLRGHSDHVYSAEFRPDGSRLVTGSRDATAKIWDVVTGREMLTLKGHTEDIASAAFSPNGRRVATASKDKTARIWDAETGHEVVTLRGHADGVRSAVFSPDSQHIVTASADKTARIWDAETGREQVTLKGHVGSVVDATFSPDGQRIVTLGWDKTVKIWDSKAPEEALVLQGHADSVRSVAFSPDSRYLVTASLDATARIWDTETGRERLTLEGHTTSVLRAALSPDGRRIATASTDKTAKLWDTQTGREVLTLRGHSGSVVSATFSPDGRHVLTVGGEKEAKIWDAESGHEQTTLKGVWDTVLSPAFSPNGRRVVTGNSDYTATVWDTDTGRQVFRLMKSTGSTASGAFSPDGTRILTWCWEKTARIWDAESGREVVALAGHANRVTWAAFSPDGRRVATAGYDNTARVWDAQSGRELLVLRGHGSPVSRVTFSPDGQRIMTGSHDSLAKIWDSETGRELLTLSQKEFIESAQNPHLLECVAFSPDGRRVATLCADLMGADGKVVVWNTLPWRDEDLPGDSSMSWDERIQLYKLEQWKRRQEAERKR